MQVVSRGHTREERGLLGAHDVQWTSVLRRPERRPIAGRGGANIDEIGAADTVEMMIQFHIGRCHPLTQNRKGQYAVDLVHPYRLVFEKNGDEIQIANILEIVDYH